MATRRANHAVTASPATAKRGRLSERGWSDVLRAARKTLVEGMEHRVLAIVFSALLRPRSGGAEF